MPKSQTIECVPLGSTANLSQDGGAAIAAGLFVLGLGAAGGGGAATALLADAFSSSTAVTTAAGMAGGAVSGAMVARVFYGGSGDDGAPKVPGAARFTAGGAVVGALVGGLYGYAMGDNR